MKGLRRAAALFLVPLLVSLLTAPVAAAPGNGTPKTNQEHASWLELDPVPATTDAASVTITGKVAGNFDMKVQNGTFVKIFQGKGKFSVTVDLFPGENRITVSGLNRAVRLLNHEVVVTRMGDQPPDPEEQAYLSPVLHGALQSDGESEALLTVSVNLSTGGLKTDYTSPVYASSSDPSVVTVVQNPVMPADGVASLRLRAGTMPGTAVLTVTAPGLPSTTLEVTVQKAPPSDLSLDISLAGTLQVNNLERATLTVRVVDSAGQVYPGFSDPITLTTSDPKVVQVAVQTIYPEDGVAAATLTAGTVAGTATITVLGPALAPTTITVTVAPPPPPALTMSWTLSGSLQAYSQSQATLTVKVVDSVTGAVAPAYASPLTFTSSNSEAARVLAATVLPVNGVASTTLASSTSDSPATITVTAPGLPTMSLLVTPNPPAPARLTLALEGVLVAGTQSQATLTATVLNAAGQTAQNYASPISFASSNADVVQVPVGPVIPANGTATAALTAGTTPGAATVTVTAPGLPPITVVVTVEAPMPPHLSLVLLGSLVANEQSQATMSVTVVDAHGAVDRNFAQPIQFASSAPGAVQVLTPAVTPVSGVATVILKAGNTAAPATITGTAPGLLESAIVITPVPQTPSHLTLVADPVNLAVGGTSQGQLFLGLKDQTGVNMLRLDTPLLIRLTTSNAGAIHFGSGQSELAVTMTAPTTNAAIYGGTAVGSAVIRGIALNGNLTADQVTVNSVIIGVPYRVSIDPITTAQADSAQVITVRLLDRFGYQVSGSNGLTDATLSSYNPDGTTTGLGTVSIVNGVGTLTWTPAAPGSYTLKADASWHGYPLRSGETTFAVTP